VRPEDMLEFDRGEESVESAGLGLGPTSRRSRWSLPFALLRRELHWFYVRMGARVPVVGSAPAPMVAAASQIAGWLGEVLPQHRGAFVLRYDGRRWPVRLVRRFGGLTSVVVRIAAMRRERGPTETVAEAEQAAVAELLAGIAAAHRADVTRREALAMDSARKLRILHRAARSYVRAAEHAYCHARRGAPCAVPSSREGA
jgi:hypothetical protein